jgi:hypothetical protein
VPGVDFSNGIPREEVEKYMGIYWDPNSGLTYNDGDSSRITLWDGKTKIPSIKSPGTLKKNPAQAERAALNAQATAYAYQDVIKREPKTRAAEDEFDNPEPGEVVYVSGHEVRTRRWTWRQSEVGKMTEKTTGVLYSIDGFSDLNLEEVKKAMKDFTELVANYFAQSGRSCTVATGIVDKDHPRFEF